MWLRASSVKVTSAVAAGGGSGAGNGGGGGDGYVRVDAFDAVGITPAFAGGTGGLPPPVVDAFAVVEADGQISVTNNSGSPQTIRVKCAF